MEFSSKAISYKDNKQYDDKNNSIQHYVPKVEPLSSQLLTYQSGWSRFDLARGPR